MNRAKLQPLKFFSQMEFLVMIVAFIPLLYNIVDILTP